ncbi:hypothetical protein ACFL5U_00935, partial [Candidatus Margulisiibacteriota bacterium]
FTGILLTAAYYFRIIQTFFSTEEFQHKPDFKPNPVGPFEHVTTYAAAGLCLVFGIFPGLVIQIIGPAVRLLLP